jgi:hypothetical protein
MHNSVLLSRRAEKFLTQLKNATLYRRLRADIDGLALNARPSGCVKLAGASLIFIESELEITASSIK